MSLLQQEIVEMQELEKLKVKIEKLNEEFERLRDCLLISTTAINIPKTPTGIVDTAIEELRRKK